MTDHRKMSPRPLALLGAIVVAVPAVAQQPLPNPAAPLPPAGPPPVAAAPANTIEGQLQPARLAVGEQGWLTFRIPDGRRLDSYPSVFEIEGLNIQYQGFTTQPYTVGGRPMRSMEIRYQVEGLEPGSYTIPQQVFSIDGKQYTAKAVQVVVSEGQPIDDALQPQAQLTVGKTEMWEGEEVMVSVSVLMHRGIQITSQPFPVIKSEGVAVSRFDRNARIDQAEIDGHLWNAWQMPSTMVPLKSGAFPVGPAEVKLEVLMPVPGAQRDPFGSFSPSVVRRTLKVKSNTVPVKVKPLPEAGKPPGFNGLVGNFQIMARSDTPSNGPQAIQLGEPVGFEVLVTGNGNFDAVQAPGLENTDGVRAYKPKVSQDFHGFGAAEIGQKSFTQILFTQKPGPLSVVFVLPYFDPVGGKYAVAKSQPVEFIVTGNPEAAAAAATTAAAETRDFSATTATPEPTEDLRDILPHPVEAGRWFSLTTASAPVHPWLLHGAPAVLLALLLGTGTVRRLRAWAVARRPPPHAPRPCTEIARDLQRGNLSLLQFYGFVSEYVFAWEYWNRSALPSDDELSRVLAARDHWLYATNAPAAASPVPRDEQSQAASVITSRLRA